MDLIQPFSLRLSSLFIKRRILSIPKPSYAPATIQRDYTQCRYASSSSNRWRSRQSSDTFSRQAKVRDLKSRAAFKLIQINDQHRLFKAGQSVVDLGFAPGSWSQVAHEFTKPNGRVVGVDIIPAQPPRGVSTIQGNFLQPEIQAYVREYLRNPDRGRYKDSVPLVSAEEGGYIDRERQASVLEEEEEKRLPKEKEKHLYGEGTVDVVLSDMSEPWAPTGMISWKRSFSDPFHRMMNTSGNKFRDHAGSMDLCLAALSFAFNTLKPGGHFICKFYQGGEDKDLEKRLKKLFRKVHREKPESSRSESRESYFVALKRKGDVSRKEIFPEEEQAETFEQ